MKSLADIAIKSDAWRQYHRDQRKPPANVVPLWTKKRPFGAPHYRTKSARQLDMIGGAK